MGYAASYYCAGARGGPAGARNARRLCPKGTDDEKTAQKFIEKLGSPNFNEATLTELKELSTQVSEAAEEQQMATKDADDIARVKEMNAIAAAPEGREARQRAATGQSLTPQQAALVKRYNELEFAHNEQARHEQHSPGGWMKTTRPQSVPNELYALERITDPREKVHAIRNLKAEMRNNPLSAFNDVKNPDHKNAVEAMNRLYIAESELGKQPEDGTE